MDDKIKRCQIRRDITTWVAVGGNKRAAENGLIRNIVVFLGVCAIFPFLGHRQTTFSN
jgi:hypothetical protein